MALITIKGAINKEVVQNKKYRETGASALADDGVTDVTSSIEITSDLDISTPGIYAVIYTLPQNLSEDSEVLQETIAVRTIEVIPTDVFDETFKLDIETPKPKVVEKSEILETSSAYFSELSLDPYEVNLLKKLTV